MKRLKVVSSNVEPMPEWLKSKSDLAREIYFIKHPNSRYNPNRKSSNIEEYNPDNRTKNNVEDVPISYKVRENSPKTKKLTKEILADINKEILGYRASKYGVSLLALGIDKDFKSKGGTSLVGQKIHSPNDLAFLSQIYRDPRVETLRAFFLKQGVVVGQTAYTSRLPGSVYLNGSFIHEIEEDKKTFDADSFYLMHNHPSGTPTPSRSDLNMSTEVYLKTDGYLGQVVINSSEYSFIDVQGDVSQHKLSNIDRFENPAVDNKHLRQRVRDPEYFVDLAKTYNFTEGPLLVSTTASSDVNLIAQIPNGVFQKNIARNPKELFAWLLRINRKVGSVSSFICVSEKEFDENKRLYENLISKKVLVDVCSPTRSIATLADRSGRLLWDAYGEIKVNPNTTKTYESGAARIKKLPVIANDVEHQKALDSTGFWGKAGAGCLVYNLRDKKFLFLKRSPYVLEPNTWGFPGGAIDVNETPQTTALRELKEETNFVGRPRDVFLLYKFIHSSGFTYSTFLVIVDKPFPVRLDWESTAYKWVELDMWPTPLHPKVKEMLSKPKVREKLADIIYGY